jgi:adenosylcobinamide-GDP ribazoletransferase
MIGARTATSLLTRIPVRSSPQTAAALGRSLPWFPVVGVVVGLGVAGVYTALRLVLPFTAAAGLALAAGVLATGALHEDGLADTADAFVGGWTTEERLRILKDPAHGTYGVLALAFSVLLRVVAISAMDSLTALFVIPAAYALSRTGSAALVATVRPAVDSGLSASYGHAVRPRNLVASVVVAAPIAIAAFGIWTVPATLLVLIAVWFLGQLSLRRIEGVTGDVLGATEQVCEVLLLLFGVVLVGHHWLTIPWWR